MIAVDITLDLALIVLPLAVIVSMGIQQREKTWAALVLVLRTL